MELNKQGNAVPSDNLRSYYFHFKPTGEPLVDKILEAVSQGGRCFHSTELWQEEYEREGLEGKSVQEWIQNAANNAAASFARESNFAKDLVLAARLLEKTISVLNSTQSEYIAHGQLSEDDLIVLSNCESQIDAFLKSSGLAV